MISPKVSGITRYPDLVKAGLRYPDLVKKQVVAELITGKSVRTMSNETGITEATIRRWGQKYAKGLTSIMSEFGIKEAIVPNWISRHILEEKIIHLGVNGVSGGYSYYTQ